MLQSNYRVMGWGGDARVVLEVQKACELTFSEAWVWRGAAAVQPVLEICE